MRSMTWGMSARAKRGKTARVRERARYRERDAIKRHEDARLTSTRDAMFFARFTVRSLREELHQLQEPGSYVGEVVKVMGKKKVLVKVRARETRAGERGRLTRFSRACRCIRRGNTSVTWIRASM